MVAKRRGGEAGRARVVEGPGEAAREERAVSVSAQDSPDPCQAGGNPVLREIMRVCDTPDL